MTERARPRRPSGSARITLRDVADAAGVHPATVSRTLNVGTRDLVNAQTADRVLATAQRLGYTPNPIARGLKTSRSYTVGVLIPDLQNPLFPPIVRGIQDRLEEAGYTPLVANTDNEADRERAVVEALGARHVDGLIAATARFDGIVQDEAAELDVPVVLVNRRLENRELPAVVDDDRAGIRLAVDHLVELGHDQIAHIAGPADLSTGRARREAFRDAIRASSLDPDEALMPIGTAFIEAEGQRLCAGLLDEGHRPTAIVAANDLMALGCYDALEEHGLRCPEDVSVVGFNDMPFASRFDPPLTTIRIPHYEMGSHAAMLLLELLAGAGTGGPRRQVLLSPELVVRASTSPPSSG